MDWICSFSQFIFLSMSRPGDNTLVAALGSVDMESSGRNLIHWWQRWDRGHVGDSGGIEVRSVRWWQRWYSTRVTHYQPNADLGTDRNDRKHRGRKRNLATDRLNETDTEIHRNRHKKNREENDKTHKYISIQGNLARRETEKRKKPLTDGS